MVSLWTSEGLDSSLIRFLFVFYWLAGGFFRFWLLHVVAIGFQWLPAAICLDAPGPSCMICHQPLVLTCQHGAAHTLAPCIRVFDQENSLVDWPLLALSCCSVSKDPLAIHAGTLDQTMTIHLLGIACKNVELPGNPWRDSILEAPSVKHNCKSNKKLWKGVEGS